MLLPETMKLLGSTENKITKEETNKMVHPLEIAEVISAHCIIVNNSYQQNLRAFYTFVPNKLFRQLLETSP